MKERHKQIRDYIVQYTTAHGWPPSVREIGEGVGLESTSSVQLHLKQMADTGIITMVPGQPRCITVPGLEIIWQERGAEHDFICLQGDPGISRRNTGEKSKDALPFRT